MRRAAKQDANQSDLIELLRTAGASVYIIGEPVDLLIGYMGITCAVEVKNKAGKNLPTRQQVAFFSEFKGLSRIVRTDEDCITLLADMRKLSGKAFGDG